MRLTADASCCDRNQGCRKISSRSSCSRFVISSASRVKFSECLSYRFVADSCVDLRGCEIRVTEQFLNCADVSAPFQHMGGKTVADCARAYTMQSSPTRNLSHGQTQGASVERTVSLVTFQVDRLEKRAKTPSGLLKGYFGILAQ